jgi:hypothetical protein
MTWPGIVALSLIAPLPRSAEPLPLLYLSFILSTVTALSLNPIEGGINILPGAVCAAFFVCKIVLAGERLRKAVEAAIEPSNLNILFVFLAYALFTAYAMPRLFARMVEVVPLNPGSNWPVALMPISANYSQSAYMALSVAGNWMRRTLNRLAPARDGLKWEAIIVAVAGVLLLAVIAFAPDVLQPAYERLDALVSKKTETISLKNAPGSRRRL